MEPKWGIDTDTAKVLRKSEEIAETRGDFDLILGTGLAYVWRRGRK